MFFRLSSGWLGIGRKMEEIILNSSSDARRIIFIFHGYGADNENMRSIGNVFADAFPQTEIRIPNGLEKCCEGCGYQWFKLEGEDTKLWDDDFIINSPKIVEYVDSVLSQKNLPYKEVIFSGFSQGGMVALSLGLQYEVKGVVSFSGILLNFQKIASCATKVMLAHGQEDLVIPFETLEITEKALKNIGIYVETAVSQNIGHSIDNYLMTQSVDFLERL
ncbi:MAG: dienelactone hydrolase family protein [Holosporaceae bacterium]|nr:dienelactone hydrolase family protein [Holosporaceae bacterium]